MARRLVGALEGALVELNRGSAPASDAALPSPEAEAGVQVATSALDAGVSRQSSGLATSLPGAVAENGKTVGSSVGGARLATGSPEAQPASSGRSVLQGAPGCAIWGVLNVTPDSFSDGGAFLALGAALDRARHMIAQGAGVVDVGGESTRPKGKTYGAGAEPVPVAEELRRVIPVVQQLAREGVAVSVDTTKPEVARAACAAGARVVNDVSCGRSEALLRAAAQAGAELVLMHNRGLGECAGDNVVYGDVVEEVRDELLEAVERAVAAGVPRERIWLDPGLGFAKTAPQSLQVLARTDVLVATGHRVLVGPSRKSFIAELTRTPGGDVPPTQERLGGSAASVAAAVLLGAHAVRVHDVAEMRQAALLGAHLRAARAEARG